MNADNGSAEGRQRRPAIDLNVVLHPSAIRRHSIGYDKQTAHSVLSPRIPVTYDDIYDEAGTTDRRAPAADSSNVRFAPSSTCADSTSYIRRM